MAPRTVPYAAPPIAAGGVSVCRRATVPATPECPTTGHARTRPARHPAHHPRPPNKRARHAAHRPRGTPPVPRRAVYGTARMPCRSPRAAGGGRKSAGSHARRTQAPSPTAHSYPADEPPRTPPTVAEQARSPCRPPAQGHATRAQTGRVRDSTHAVPIAAGGGRRAAGGSRRAHMPAAHRRQAPPHTRTRPARHPAHHPQPPDGRARRAARPPRSRPPGPRDSFDVCPGGVSSPGRRTRHRGDGTLGSPVAHATLTDSRSATAGTTHRPWPTGLRCCVSAGAAVIPSRWPAGRPGGPRAGPGADRPARRP